MTASHPTLLEVSNLTKHFPRQAGSWGKKPGVVRAVDGVSFQIREGETLGLVGESGSGKSTTGRLILRLIEATAGTCTFGGRNVFELRKDELRAIRREMQIVFQDPYGAFNPRLTVGNIIGEGLELRGLTNRAERDSEVSRLLELVQLPREYRHRFPHEFSGGQRQRIGIARALAVEPRFIIADEPVSALDVSTQAEVVNLLLDLQEKLNLTMLFISHDLSVVRVVSDRVGVLFAGKLLELGDTDALFRNPLQPYTRELLAAVPLPDPTRAQREPRRRKTDVEDVPATAASAPRTANDGGAPAPTGCPYATRCPYVMDVCRQEMPAFIDYGPRLAEASPHWAACHWTEQQHPPVKSAPPA